MWSVLLLVTNIETVKPAGSGEWLSCDYVIGGGALGLHADQTYLSNTSVHLQAAFPSSFSPGESCPEQKRVLNVILFLQVHPQGWCVVSRNTSGDEAYEVQFVRN